MTGLEKIKTEETTPKTDYNKQYYQAHREKLLQRSVDYYQKNKQVKQQYYQDNKDRLLKYANEYQHQRLSSLEGRYEAWKQNAATNGHEWAVTFENIKNLYALQEGRCWLTGKTMIFTPCEDFVISLDRIDSDKGYLIDNIQMVCADVNYMKRKLSMEKFLLLCNFIAKKYPLDVEIE